VPDVSRYIERAENEVKRRNYDEAISLYSEILQIDPDCGEARSGIRRAALKKLEKRYPSPFLRGILNFPTFLLLGLAGLFRAHGWTVNLCEAALRRDPRNAALNDRLGRALLELGHRDGALAAYKVATEYDSKNIEALKTLGRLLYERKELDEALKCFEKALKINPRDQEANKMRKNLAAEGAIKKGGYAEATSARDLAKSARQLKESEQTRKIVRTTEDLQAAIAEEEAALEENPEDVKLLLRLGTHLVQARKLDEAVDTFLRVTRIDPENVEALERLGDTRIRRLELRIQEAEKDVRAGEEGAPERAARLRRDLTLLQIEEFERRVELHPTDLGLRFRLGQALIKDGRLDEAIEQFQQAVKDPKHRVQALHQLGRAFGRKGIMDLAMKQLQEAESALSGMTPQRKEILYDLAQICEKAGATEEALKTYKRIYEADISFKDVGPRIEALSGS